MQFLSDHNYGDFSIVDNTAEFISLGGLRSGLNYGVIKGAAQLTKQRSGKAIASSINNRVRGNVNRVGATIGTNLATIGRGVKTTTLSARSGLNSGLNKTATVLTKERSLPQVKVGGRVSSVLPNAIRPTKDMVRSSVTPVVRKAPVAAKETGRRRTRSSALPQPKQVYKPGNSYQSLNAMDQRFLANNLTNSYQRKKAGAIR